MFHKDPHAKEKIILDFGGAPVESFSGLVKVDDVPEYCATGNIHRPTGPSRAEPVDDDVTAIFKALGLI